MKSCLIFGLLLLTSCGKATAPHQQQSAQPIPSAHAESVAQPKASSSTLARKAPVPNVIVTSELGVAPTQPPKRRYSVAVLGDSITDARSMGGGYLNVLRAKCPESQFINFGKGGDMLNQMRKRWFTDIKPQVRAKKLDTLIVYGGVNDLYSDLTAGRTNTKIESDLTEIYRSARESSLRVIAITVSPWGGFRKYWNPRRGMNTRLLNSWILGQVATKGLDVAVDSFPLLSCGDPDRLCPKYETRHHDGIHPGSEGHRILGEKLANEAFNDCL